MSVESRKFFIAYLLLALVGTQFVLAQHSIIHLDSSATLTQHKTDEEKNKSDLCKLCVVVKNLSQHFLAQSNSFFASLKSDYITFCLQAFACIHTLNKPFQSQAPPEFFS